MVDNSKRKTLKLMSGAGAAAMYSFSALAAGTGFKPVDTQNGPAKTNISKTPGSFNIQIIAGSTTPEDTIILINESGADIRIEQFLPGLVTQNNQMFDLNSLLVNGPVILKHGYPFSSTATRWELLSLNSDQSYLWCDNAVSKLSNSDTGVITLDAIINNGRALLTARHDEILLS